MKRLLLIILIICTSLVQGCINKDDGNSTQKINNNIKATEEVDRKEQELQKQLTQIKEIEESFIPLSESVEQNDMATFMTFQNEENVLFYKEQQRWFEEVVYKKEKGYEYNIELSNVLLNSKNNGQIDFVVSISPPSSTEGLVHNVSYEIIKYQDKWKLNDIPFEELSDGIFTIYYLDGLESVAYDVLKDAKDIVELYSSTFGWQPESINVKLYDSMEEMNATIPWIRAGGWNEKGESYKLIANTTEEAKFALLTHELTHTFLSDLTNDNASLYLQEGLATMFQIIVSRNESGIVVMNLDQSTDQLKVLKEKLNRPLLTLEELSNLDYDNGAPFYQDGALLTNYLIQTKGIEEYKLFLAELKNYPYIDKRQEHKLEIGNQHTLESLEKMFAPTTELFNKYSTYY